MTPPQAERFGEQHVAPERTYQLGEDIHPFQGEFRIGYDQGWGSELVTVLPQDTRNISVIASPGFRVQVGSNAMWDQLTMHVHLLPVDQAVKDGGELITVTQTPEGRMAASKSRARTLYRVVPSLLEVPDDLSTDLDDPLLVCDVVAGDTVLTAPLDRRYEYPHFDFDYARENGGKSPSFVRVTRDMVKGLALRFRRVPAQYFL